MHACVCLLLYIHIIFDMLYMHFMDYSLSLSHLLLKCMFKKLISFLCIIFSLSHTPRHTQTHVCYIYICVCVCVCVWVYVWGLYINIKVCVCFKLCFLALCSNYIFRLKCLFHFIIRRHDAEHNDILHNINQQNDSQHNIK